MQKARRHPNGLRPLVGIWFQVLFTPLFRVLFTFPSRYQFTIGILGVFSLTGWFRQIHTKFHMFRATQDTTRHNATLRLRDYHPLWLYFPVYSTSAHMNQCSPTTPILPKQNWFGLFPVRSPLLRESLLFSLPPGTQMFQFSGFAS